MPIHVACPACQKEYDLSSELAGKRVRCKACQTGFPVPNDSPSNGNAPAIPESTMRAGPETAELPGADKVPVLDFAADDEEAEVAPSAAGRRSRAAGDKAPAKSRTWVYLLVGGVAAAFLLLGAVVVVGVVGWLAYRGAPAGPNLASNNPAPTESIPNPEEKTKPDPNPKPNPKPDPKPHPKPDPNPVPKPAPDDPPLGAKLNPDPPREPLRAPADPRATLPLSNGQNNPVRYPWGFGPFVAVQSPKNNDTVWDIWNLQSMKQLGSVPGLAGGEVQFSADGTYVAADMFEPGSLKPLGLGIFTVADGKLVRKVPFKIGSDSRRGFSDFAGSAHYLSLVPEGFGGEATVSDAKTGDTICTFQTVGQISRKAAALSPGGKYLAMLDSFAPKRPIQIYEVATGKNVRTIFPKLPSFSCLALAFSYDGKELALLGVGDFNANYVQAWDFETGKRTVDHRFTTSLAKTAKAGGQFLLDAYPAELEWLPDRSGWFAYGQLMIDHDRGNVFWSLPPDNLNVLWFRRFLDAGDIATIRVKEDKRHLEIITLPKDEIEAARKK
jgi:outer membrane biosynthesis protein TonB